MSKNEEMVSNKNVIDCTTSSVSIEAYYVEKEIMSVDQKLPLSTRLKDTFLTRDGWFGNYDYKALCMPRIPCYKKKVGNSLFYGPEDVPPVFVAFLMGVQRKYNVNACSFESPSLIRKFHCIV